MKALNFKWIDSVILLRQKIDLRGAITKVRFISIIIKITIILVIGVGFVLRAINLNYNTPFLDEATYIMLGLPALHGDFFQLTEAVYWVGGWPYSYPVFAAILYKIGGIVASRFGSAIVGTITIFFIYTFTKNLRFYSSSRDNQVSGLVGAALFATAAVPLYLSRTALYDALSYLFFAAGLVLLQATCKKYQRTYAVFSACLFFASFITKYITGIYLPFIVLFVLLQIKKTSSGRHRLILMREFIFVLCFLIVMYGLINFDGLRSFMSTNAATTGTSVANILNSFWYPSRLLFLLALGGGWFLFDNRRSKVLILYAAAAVPLIAHIVIRNSDAATQSSFLSLVFLIPIAGWLLTELVRWNKVVSVVVIVTLIGVNYATARGVLADIESAWPNSSGSIAYLRSRVTRADRLLAEGDDIYALGLFGQVTPEHITGPFVFTYGVHEGTEAYIAALTDKHFRFVELEGIYFSESDILKIETQLSINYALVWDDDTIQIYERFAP
ncbi:TPA: hypothetical protein DIV55_00645 [Patescibacteria group bacterium]|uniref:Uncharacterized protein n=1 Tax=Candidatus Gottesmanbacteria bacterium GW2011_GWA1_43_11 TaxID=1618436 RepID=A0A0G1FFZ6_9BACT|nr:MAG: hypothetical protein UV59_C0005G0029 [Candidatus Gottesmanbacteria bacterium GW2011_GWA1_43_11]HCS78232.1 hypothetical protein [Patescibacteria group bacterium]